MAVRNLGERQPRVAPDAFVAWSADVVGDVELASGASVWYGAVLRGDIAPIRVGRNANVQDGSVLHTDRDRPCVVGEGVTVGHGAILHGCLVEAGALIGMRATVLTGAVIGAGAVVAAGALVPEGAVVPPGMVAMGIPARVTRPVRPEEARRAREGTEHYVELSMLHRAAGATMPPR